MSGIGCSPVMNADVNANVSNTSFLPITKRRQSHLRPTNKGPVKTFVAFVTSKNAKQLKTALEVDLFLDKIYRMTRANRNFASDDNSTARHIAVPITPECVWAVNDPDRRKDLSWIHLVAEFGTYQVPYSSSMQGLMK